jgi:hypothetical protein
MHMHGDSTMKYVTINKVRRLCIVLLDKLDSSAPCARDF